MKNIRISLFAIALVILTLTACKKDDNSSNSSTNSIIQQGTWKVTLYNDSGTDELYHFSGYVFTFGSTGSVSAVSPSGTINGTWNTGSDDSQQKLVLNFGSTSPFDKLNSDWHVIEKTDLKIRLEDVSGGNGGTDLLTFEKN